MASIRDLLNTGNMDDILLALRLARGQTGASQGQARGAEMDPNAVGTDQQYWSPEQGQTDFNPSLLDPNAVGTDQQYWSPDQGQTDFNPAMLSSLSPAQTFNQGDARRGEPGPEWGTENEARRLSNYPRNTITKEWDNPNIFDQPKPLPKNYIKNERTGVVIDLGPSQTQPQGERILDSQVQRDGSTLQMVEVPSYDGDGRQSMVKQVRRIIPDHLNPAMRAKVEYENKLATGEHTRAETKKLGQPTASKGNFRDLVSPDNPKIMITVNTDVYRGGGVGSPGVIGIAGKEPSAAKREETQQSGMDSFDTVVSALKRSYDVLKANGDISSSQKGAIANSMNAVQSSGFGQSIGRIVGTQSQDARNAIFSSRNILMQGIKNATGMGQREMDSNADVQRWLDSVTNPTLTYESNMEVLKNIQDFVNAKAGAVTKIPSTATAVDKGAVVVQGGVQYPVISREPDGSVKVRDPKTGKIGTLRP